MADDDLSEAIELNWLDRGGASRAPDRSMSAGGGISRSGPGHSEESRRSPYNGQLGGNCEECQDMFATCGELKSRETS